MSSLLPELGDQPERSFAAGETVIREGEHSGHLYFLVEGSVEVTKGGVATLLIHKGAELEESDRSFLESEEEEIITNLLRRINSEDPLTFTASTTCWR